MTAIRTTDQCFADYISSPGDRNAKRVEIAQYLGIPIEPTIRRWFNGKNKPKGEYRVKLRYFLESKGYRVSELERLTPAVYKAGLFFAQNQRTIGQVADMFGYTSANKITQALNVLHGHTEPRVTNVPAEPRGAQPQKPVSSVAAKEQGEKKPMLEAAAHFVSGLIPVADFLLSDACSEEDRKRLHELAGADSVLKLITRLRRLCSETARRQFKDN